MLINIIIFTIIFCIFVEVYIGSIFIRINSENQYSFSISSLEFLINPLYNSFLWNSELLLVNYPFVLLIYIFILVVYLNGYYYKKYMVLMNLKLLI